LNTAEEQVRAFSFSLNSCWSIAIAAPDIAPRKADKDMPLADPGALALNRAEDFLYAGFFHAANNTEQHHELQVKLPNKSIEQPVPALAYAIKRQKKVGFKFCLLHLFVDKKTRLS
jgi:hypothetical protein